MRIYLAGPMSNLPDFNFRAFRKKTKELRAQGHEVFSPVESDVMNYGCGIFKNANGDIAKAEREHGFSLREALARDLIYICHEADAVYLLKGWENSKGASAEHAVAVALGLEIIYERGGGSDDAI